MLAERKQAQIEAEHQTLHKLFGKWMRKGQGSDCNQFIKLRKEQGGQKNILGQLRLPKKGRGMTLFCAYQ